MTISLVAPTGAVTTLEGGLVAVRCFDYPGAARGSLTTPTEAGAVAGDVVRDEQTLAVQTTFVTQEAMWGLADDSVVIPLADLGLVESLVYQVYLGVRLEGEAPSAAQARSTWLSYAYNGASVGFGFGYDSQYLSGPDHIARSLIEEYLLYPVGSWSHNDVSATDLVLRGWGITGGDIAIRFDMLYLIPVGVWDDDPPLTSNSDFLPSGADEFLPMTLLSNGIVDPDDDNTTVVIGNHSVLNWDFPWTEEAGSVDLQDTNDEPTVENVNGFGFWDGSGTDYDAVADPPSWLAVPVGTVCVAAHTITDEPFDEADGVKLWRTPEDYAVSMGNINFGGQYVFPSDGRVGWEHESSVARCFIPENQSAGARARGQIGVDFSVPSFPAPTNPSAWTRRLDLTPGGILTAKFSFDTVQEQAFQVGLVGGDNSQFLFTAKLAMDGAGDCEFSLIAEDVISAALGNLTFDGPVSVLSGYTPDAWLWVKVEKRGYHWRARFWEDGDTEPSTWDVEGHEPLGWSNAAQSIKGWMAYPYDDEWESGTLANHDLIVHDPRGHRGFDWGSLYPVWDLTAPVGSGVHSTATLDSYKVEWTPGSGTVGDMSVEVEKYDGSVSEGTLVVAREAHRMMYGDVLVRRFNGDTDGFNIRAWMDSGSPLLQTAGVGAIFERRRNYLPWVPHIYRRTYG